MRSRHYHIQSCELHDHYTSEYSTCTTKDVDNRLQTGVEMCKSNCGLTGGALVSVAASWSD